MPLAILTVCISVAALLASGFAIWQTQRFQDRAWLHARWDRIGLTGGIEEQVFGVPPSTSSIPYIKVVISNHGRDVARMIDVTTSTVVVGFTQETDDGTRPYQERAALAPGEAWEIAVPLFTLQETFDHPFTVLDETLKRPTLHIRWLEYYSRRMQTRKVTLDGPWLQLYGEARESILESQTYELQRKLPAHFLQQIIARVRYRKR